MAAAEESDSLTSNEWQVDHLQWKVCPVVSGNGPAEGSPAELPVPQQEEQPQERPGGARSLRYAASILKQGFITETLRENNTY